MIRGEAAAGGGPPAGRGVSLKEFGCVPIQPPSWHPIRVTFTPGFSP